MMWGANGAVGEWPWGPGPAAELPHANMRAGDFNCAPGSVSSARAAHRREPGVLPWRFPDLRALRSCSPQARPAAGTSDNIQRSSQLGGLSSQAASQCQGPRARSGSTGIRIYHVNINSKTQQSLITTFNCTDASVQFEGVHFKMKTGWVFSSLRNDYV